MAKIDTVKTYLAALNAKNVDQALGCFAEGAVVQAPHGVQTGKAEIRAGLEAIVSRAAPGAQPDVAEEGGQVVARGQTPNGTMLMRFDFAGDLISRQTVTIG